MNDRLRHKRTHVSAHSTTNIEYVSEDDLLARNYVEQGEMVERGLLAYGWVLGCSSSSSSIERINPLIEQQRS